MRVVVASGGRGLHPKTSVAGTTPLPVARHWGDGATTEVTVAVVGFETRILYDIGGMKWLGCQSEGGSHDNQRQLAFGLAQAALEWFLNDSGELGVFTHTGGLSWLVFDRFCLCFIVAIINKRSIYCLFAIIWLFSRAHERAQERCLAIGYGGLVVTLLQI